MPVREFHIAPDPDTVIVLRSPCVNFASWEEVVAPVDKVTKGEEIADGWGFPAPIRKKKSKRRREESVSEPNSLFGSDAGNTSYPELGPAGDTVTEGTVASPGLSKDENHSNDVPAIFAQDEQQISDEAARYYVSFRHLITASPCFHRMLTKDKWNESERDKKDGLFHLSAEDWDVYAFLLLLNILHLKNRQVPRKVSLDDLAKIAVLVDYYECAEAIELFSDMWIQYLIKVVPIPSEYCRPLVLWIWIAWVFERAHEFKNATLVAIKQCSKPICTLGLPIPDRVSGKTSIQYRYWGSDLSSIENIDIRRYQFIEHTIEGLHSLRDKYKSLEYECPSNRSTDDSFECGSLLYGVRKSSMVMCGGSLLSSGNNTRRVISRDY